MRLLQPRRLPGGLSFAATKRDILDMPIETLPARETLRVSLCVMHAAEEKGDIPVFASSAFDHSPAAHQAKTRMSPFSCLVDEGELVEAGRLLAQGPVDRPRWARVFAPIRGILGHRVLVETYYGSRVPAVELVPTGGSEDAAGVADRPPVLTPAASRPEVGTIRARLGDLGIAIDPEADPCPDGTNLGTPSRPGQPQHPLEWIVIDGLETTPYATARTRTLLEHTEELVHTADQLGGVLGVNAVHLAVDRALGARVNLLRRQVRGTRVTIVPLPNRYPQCHPRPLFPAVTGRTVSPDRTPRELGAWILGTCTLWDIHQAWTNGIPPTTQTLTVAGDVVQRPGNYRVPLGTSVAALLQRVGLNRPPARIVLGNALTGTAVGSGEAVITRGVEGLYAWSASARPEREPIGCLRCGFCIDFCPAGIDPVGVFNEVERDRLDRAAAWAPQACLGCGLCDYVCPSVLPLMDAVLVARRFVGGGKSW